MPGREPPLDIFGAPIRHRCATEEP
jgi:hypothetical protein